MLVSAGLNDPRVTYWEPAKWVAKLRATRLGDATLLLRTNMGAGHAGKSGRRGALREDAEEFAFVLTQLGVEKKRKWVTSKTDPNPEGGLVVTRRCLRHIDRKSVVWGKREEIR